MPGIQTAPSPIRFERDLSPSHGKVGSRSLEGLSGTVPLPSRRAGFWRQLRAFGGPAFLVSVGYMDPGNWSSGLDAGAKYKFGLLWVVALASIMAIFMQVIAARFGVATGKDLAQACRDYYPSWTRWPMWLFCEIAIGACDLAEVLGSAVALKLLFGIPLLWAVIITAFDVLLLLALQGWGMRFIEAVILALVSTIGICYFIEVFVLPATQPSFLEMGDALLTPGFREAGMLWGAIAIIGATVMPHNLYLHSALVQSRSLRPDPASKRTAIYYNTVDTVAALSVAFLVNAAILILAAQVFHPVLQSADKSVTLPDGEVVSFQDPDWIPEAYRTLTPLVQNVTAASILFAIALFASGQSSTITGTLAGQVVMEGFMHWRIRPWMRRLLTRSLAITPAIIIIALRPGVSITDLLNLSQVVLALQLPFAMFPLLQFTSSKKRMGRFVNGRFLLVAGWTSCLFITVMDIISLPQVLGQAWAVIAGTAPPS